MKPPETFVEWWDSDDPEQFSLGEKAGYRRAWDLAIAAAVKVAKEHAESDPRDCYNCAEVVADKIAKLGGEK